MPWWVQFAFYPASGVPTVVLKNAPAIENIEFVFMFRIF